MPPASTACESVSVAVVRASATGATTTRAPRTNIGASRFTTYAVSQVEPLVRRRRQLEGSKRRAACSTARAPRGALARTTAGRRLAPLADSDQRVVSVDQHAVDLGSVADLEPVVHLGGHVERDRARKGRDGDRVLREG